MDGALDDLLLELAGLPRGRPDTSEEVDRALERVLMEIRSRPGTADVDTLLEDLLSELHIDREVLLGEPGAREAIGEAMAERGTDEAWAVDGILDDLVAFAADGDEGVVAPEELEEAAARIQARARAQQRVL